MKKLLRLSEQKVLVTGASGFIGSHLCRSLNNAGLEVHAISRRITTKWRDRITWWQGDLSDYLITRYLVTNIKPDLIFHLASYVTGSRDRNLVIPILHNNLLTTVNLLTAASEIGCKRIILAGSMEEPCVDSDFSIPISPYAAAKWASSAYGRMFHLLYQLPVVILKVFMVYGPAQKDRKKLIPYLINSLLKKEPPKLSDGKRRVDWIYVEDVVKGFLTAAFSPNIEGKTIDIGSGELISIRSIVDLICRLINRNVEPVFGAVPQRPFEQETVADIGQTNLLIGWKPEIGIEEGLKQTLKWYKKNKIKNGSKES